MILLQSAVVLLGVFTLWRMLVSGARAVFIGLGLGLATGGVVFAIAYIAGVAIADAVVVGIVASEAEFLIVAPMTDRYVAEKKEEQRERDLKYLRELERRRPRTDDEWWRYSAPD